MVRCVECQKKMIPIGTKNFQDNLDKTNFSVDGIVYKIMIAFYCSHCNVLFLREPQKVYG